jgi:small subunit ribosomal protein S16
LVKLRLKRIGKRHYPVYKIVAADARSPRDGRFIEAVGTYNPNTEPVDVNFKEERVLYWLKVGAQPTDTVRSILKDKGLFLKWHLEKKGAGEEDINSALEKFNAGRESQAERTKQKKLRRKERKAKGAAKPEESAAAPAASEEKSSEEQTA